jgi:excisionase family DNA binding protein
VTISRRTPLLQVPELLRAEEAASCLVISRTLAYQLVQRGDLPTVRFGRLLRVRRDRLLGVVAETGRTKVDARDQTEATS